MFGFNLIGLANNVSDRVTDWFKKPYHWLKALCAVLAFFFATAALTAYVQTVRVADEKAKVVATKIEAAEKVRKANEIAAKWEKSYNELSQENADAIKAATARQKQLLEDNRKELAALEAKAKQAETNFNLFKKQYDNRSDVCRAAQKSLDVVCKELGDL